MPVADLVAAFKARWRLELAVTLAVFALALLSSFAMHKVYAASSTLLIDERAPDPGANAGASPAPVDMQQVIATQTDIIKSDEVAHAVVRKLNLTADPLTQKAWRKATGGYVDAETWVAQGLLGHLTVDSEHSSNVLSIRYVSPRAAEAAQMANAFAQAYLDEHLSMTTDPAKTYTRWFEVRMGDVRGNLQKAQGALADFQRRHGIVGSQNVDAEGERLNALSQQLATAEADQAAAHSRAGADRGASTEVQSSTVVAQLRSEIAQKAATVANLRGTLGPNHPELMGAESELATLRARLGAEQGTMSQSLAVASSDASQRVASLRAVVDAQRGKMLAMQADRSQLEVLQRDVTSASAAYDGMEQRLSAMRLQAELPRTNVRQLDKATEPLFPSSPNIPMRAVMGLILGAILGATLAAALEWWKPRVRSRAGIAQMAGAPVLASIDLGRSRTVDLLRNAA
jgi:succinoglycan biosynthesis transport protein ExoP